jgi:hypothetical protein
MEEEEEEEIEGLEGRNVLKGRNILGHPIVSLFTSTCLLQ